MDLAYSVKNLFAFVPVILTSGTVEEAPTGFTFVRKPFKTDDILNAIDKAMIRTSAEARDETMRPRQLLRLNRDTPAINNSDRKPTAIIVPLGAIIFPTGATNPDNPQMIEVQNERRIFMFAVDVQERGEKTMSA